MNVWDEFFALQCNAIKKCAKGILWLVWWFGRQGVCVKSYIGKKEFSSKNNVFFMVYNIHVWNTCTKKDDKIENSRDGR